MLKAVLVGLLAALLASAAVAQPVVGRPAVTAAISWLSLVDKGQYGQSWSSASGMFQHRLAQDKWSTMVAQVRAPLGQVSTRALLGVRETHQLPGAPSGEYRIVQFNTAFAHKPHAIELVVMDGEAGQWKAAGYFVR